MKWKIKNRLKKKKEERIAKGKSRIAKKKRNCETVKGKKGHGIRKWERNNGGIKRELRETNRKGKKILAGSNVSE